jgi:hypothetical protein
MSFVGLERVRLKPHKYFLEEGVKNSIDSIPQLYWGFRVPEVKVGE